MEEYLWMAIGAVVVGFFAKTYWDVFQAYRAYMNNAPRQSELAGPSGVTPLATAPRLLTRVLARADRFLHAMLMSPTSR